MKLETIYTHIIADNLTIPAAVTIEEHKMYVAIGDTTHVIPIKHNKNYAWKLNKSCISTNHITSLHQLFSEKSAGNVNAYINATVNALIFKYSQDVAAVSKAIFYNSLSDEEFLTLFDNSSQYEKLQIIYDHFCTRHTGKMTNIVSYSTSVLENKYCQARRANCPGSVCNECFACSQLECYAESVKKLHRATLLATRREWTAAITPYFNPYNWPLIRLESFGDIQNIIQVKNYFLIASENPKSRVALWTKNPGIIRAAIKAGAVKPDNLNIGLSSLYINKPASIETLSQYDFIDFNFTVYDADYIEEHNTVINCGARSCYTCQKCYTKTDGLQLINERLK